METLIWFHPRVEQKDKLIVKENIQVLPTKFQDISEFNLDKNKKYKLALVYHQTNNQNIPFRQENFDNNLNKNVTEEMSKKYKKFSKELITLVECYNIEVLDLLTCDSEPFEKIEGLEIRYSLDKTGNENGDSTNWILESHEINVKDEYFSSTEGFTEILWEIDFLLKFFKESDTLTDISGIKFTTYNITDDVLIENNDVDYFPIELYSESSTTKGVSGGKLKIQDKDNDTTPGNEDHQIKYNLIINGGGVNYIGKNSKKITIRNVGDFPGLFTTKNYNNSQDEPDDLFTDTGDGGKKLIIKNIFIEIEGTSSLVNDGGWIAGENFCHGGCYGFARRANGIHRDPNQNPMVDFPLNGGITFPSVVSSNSTYRIKHLLKMGIYPFKENSPHRLNSEINEIGGDKLAWVNTALIECCQIHCNNNSDYLISGGEEGGIIVGRHAGTYGGIIHIIGNLINFQHHVADQLIGRFKESTITITKNPYDQNGANDVGMVKDLQDGFHLMAMFRVSKIPRSGVSRSGYTTFTHEMFQEDLCKLVVEL